MNCPYCHIRPKLYKEDNCGHEECHNLSLANRRRKYGKGTQKVVDFIPTKSRPIDSASPEWQANLRFLEDFYAGELAKPKGQRLSITDLHLRHSKKYKDP